MIDIDALRAWLQDPLNYAIFNQLLDMVKWSLIGFCALIWRKSIVGLFTKK